MSDQEARGTTGRRLLFAVTDSRSMGVALVAMTVLLVFSVALGGRTAVVYPWTAPALAIAEPPVTIAEPHIPAEPVETEDVAVREERSGIRLPDQESDEPALRAQELNAFLADEAARRDFEAREAALAERRLQEIAATEAARALDEAAASAAVRSAPNQETATAAVRDPAPDASRTPDRASSPDLSGVTNALTDADTALGADDFDRASIAISRAQTALTAVGGELGSESRELLAGRIGELRAEIAVRRLEHDISDLIAKARVSQEAGDYPSAITVLRRLQGRATEGSSSQQEQVQELLDLFRVTETIEELREACQFEIDFLGRTEPCEAR